MPSYRAVTVPGSWRIVVGPPPTAKRLPPWTTSGVPVARSDATGTSNSPGLRGPGRYSVVVPPTNGSTKAMASSRNAHTPRVRSSSNHTTSSRGGNRSTLGTGSSGRCLQSHGGVDELAEAVEGHLEPAIEPAVGVGGAVLVGGHPPVAEPAAEMLGGVGGASQPAPAVLHQVVAAHEAGQLDGVAHGERARRATPRHRRAVRGGDRVHELEGAPGALHPTDAEPVGERLAEEVQVDRVEVVAPDGGVAVVEVATEEPSDAGEQVVEADSVVEQPELVARGLAAGEDGGVVARQQAGVEELHPRRGVGRLDHRRALVVVERGDDGVVVVDAPEAGDGLGHPVGVEGVDRRAVDPSEQRARWRR